MQALTAGLEKEFAYCADVTAQHYENFSVISWFIPKDLRPHFCALYAYCRGVDDLGDEWTGNRLEALDQWEQQLDLCYNGRPTHPIFRALQISIQTYHLEKRDFLALIEANRMDQSISSYETFSDLAAYCACSANPVGRLVLQLFGYRDDRRQKLSDDICTALQLANFLQDLSVDIPRGRLYIPLEDLRQFDVDLTDLQAGHFNRQISCLMDFEIQRTEQFFRSGQPLEHMVPTRLGKQLRLYRLGGQAILEALRRRGGNPFPRPTVSALAKAMLIVKLFISPRHIGGESH
ncbi:squalene synthase HpnC [Alicyclobacillus sp. TC]|uniref:squalene synthase HpnC n=1 Tax=Alicyclobacillus sp. TC TaxID=2606450 RepID=UPI0019329C52|nr:squalene synthase HpnC [Alicyclobacillus sp. TC]QRF23927.1 squalene synthase HpnC [Alicyclobacillus sp. TC]